MDVYASEFRDRCLRYPWAWHICAQADARCRSEWWLQERRLQEAFHTASPAMSVFDPMRPWNTVIRNAASDIGFWDKELREPALLYCIRGGMGRPVKSGRRCR